MKKELVCYISTNEEGEECKVQRVAADPQFYLLTLGQTRMVLNIGELLDAIGAIGHYSTLFDQEEMMRDARAKIPIHAVTPIRPKSKEEEDGIDITTMSDLRRTGPTASELALEAQTKHMHGDEIVVVEKKDE
jgi:hypothetical protein